MTEGVEVNVLWIDDEHEKLSGFKARFKRNGITLDAVKSKNRGMKKLRSHIEQYDAIILDGKIFEHEDNIPGTEDIRFSLELNSLFAELPKKLEIFVLTGQAEVFKDNTYKKVYKKVFKKGSDDDVELLIHELKQAARDQFQYQIRHKYQEVFKVLESEYIGKEQFNRLMRLASDLESEETSDSSEDRFNTLRKVVEVVFERLVELSLVPKAIKNDGGWINKSSLFLANKHNEYEHKIPFIPAIVAELFHRVLNITQDGSHGAGNLYLGVDEFVKESSTDYLYRSTVLALFEILVWFRKFVDSNPNEVENKGLWERKQVLKEWQSGTVTKIADNGFGTLNLDGTSVTLTVPDRMVLEYELSENDRVKVTTTPSPDGKKTYIKDIEVIRS